jgi:hypothetical protein
VSEQEQTQLAANAANWLKDHRPTLLVNSGGVEAWRFKQPGSNNLAFDICVTRYGIAMFGDIDGLTWRVGADYGINFLRNRSIGYVHEKLESGCKEVEIDKPAIFKMIHDAIEDMLSDADVQHDDFEDIDGLCEWMKTRVDAEDASQPYEEWLDLISDVEAFDEGSDRDCVPAYDLLTSNEELLGGDDWHSCLDKPTKSLMQRLEYVRYAADQIMAMKELGSPAQ